jgi:hypothetical protein
VNEREAAVARTEGGDAMHGGGAAFGKFVNEERGERGQRRYVEGCGVRRRRSYNNAGECCQYLARGREERWKMRGRTCSRRDFTPMRHRYGAVGGRGAKAKANLEDAARRGRDKGAERALRRGGSGAERAASVVSMTAACWGGDAGASARSDARGKQGQSSCLKGLEGERDMPQQHSVWQVLRRQAR